MSEEETKQSENQDALDSAQVRLEFLKQQTALLQKRLKSLEFIGAKIAEAIPESAVEEERSPVLRAKPDRQRWYDASGDGECLIGEMEYQCASFAIEGDYCVQLSAEKLRDLATFAENGAKWIDGKPTSADHIAFLQLQSTVVDFGVYQQECDKLRDENRALKGRLDSLGDANQKLRQRVSELCDELKRMHDRDDEITAALGMGDDSHKDVADRIRKLRSRADEFLGQANALLIAHERQKEVRERLMMHGAQWADVLDKITEHKRAAELQTEVAAVSSSRDAGKYHGRITRLEQLVAKLQSQDTDLCKRLKDVTVARDAAFERIAELVQARDDAQRDAHRLREGSFAFQNELVTVRRDLAAVESVRDSLAEQLNAERSRKGITINERGDLVFTDMPGGMLREIRMWMVGILGQPDPLGVDVVYDGDFKQPGRFETSVIPRLNRLHESLRAHGFKFVDLGEMIEWVGKRVASDLPVVVHNPQVPFQLSAEAMHSMSAALRQSCEKMLLSEDSDEEDDEDDGSYDDEEDDDD